MYTQTRKESGFTLVELAIVLVIVGLLIAGILKGQELISNAQANATAASAKALDAAMVTFKDTYYYLPGDVPGTAAQVTAKIPNCSATPCATSGTGDSRIGATNAMLIAQTAALENTVAFAQLAAANLIGGVQPASTTIEFGTSHPAAPVGGGFKVGFTTAGVPVASGAVAVGQAGHYLALVNSASAASDAASTVLTQSQAERIDKKLDDGFATSGSVIGIGSVGATAANCTTASTIGLAYSISGNQVACGLLIRVLN